MGENKVILIKDYFCISKNRAVLEVFSQFDIVSMI